MSETNKLKLASGENNTASKPGKTEMLYKIDDKIPFHLSVILAFQHIMAAFGGIVAVPLVVGGALGLPVQDIAFMVCATIFVSGVTTFLQARGLWKIGAKLPCVMGTDFTFVGPSIAVGSTLGLPGIFGATILGSFVEIFLSKFIKPLMRFFPPIVTGTVVALIGLTLLPVAIDWAAGGFGSQDYGNMTNIAIAFFVLLIVVLLNQYGKGIVSGASILIGMVIGYVICIPLGMIDFTPVAEAKFIAFPSIAKFGIEFSWVALITFVPAYLVTTIETVGCLIAVGDAAEKDMKSEDISNGLLCDGVGSFIAGFFGAGPNTSFSQNIGLISLTRVASRYVVVIAGVILMLLGIFPKFGAIIAIIPNPVLGGAGIVMFGAVAVAGMKTIGMAGLTNRNMLIAAVSIALGLGISVRPEFISKLPDALKMIFSSGISTGTIVALLLNIILKEDKVVVAEQNVLDQAA